MKIVRDTKNTTITYQDVPAGGIFSWKSCSVSFLKLSDGGAVDLRTFTICTKELMLHLVYGKQIIWDAEATLTVNY